MNSVGERLRRQREKLGLSLPQVADQTCIRQWYLEAIEADQWDKLPGGFFTRSFVRQYANALGLTDPAVDSAISTFDAGDAAGAPLLPGQAPGPAFDVPPMPVAMTAFRSESRRRAYWSAAALVFVLSACSGVFALWQGFRDGALQWPTISFQRNTPNTAAATTVPPAAIPTPAAKPVIEQQPPSQLIDMGSTPQPPATTTEPQPSHEPPAVTVSHEPPASGESKAKLFLNVSANEETWLRVTSDGKVIFSGVLKAAESTTVQGNESARLRTGNAGGIDVKWNGKPIGPLGPKGHVREIEFTPESFQFVPSAPLKKADTPPAGATTSSTL